MPLSPQQHQQTSTAALVGAFSRLLRTPPATPRGRRGSDTDGNDSTPRGSRDCLPSPASPTNRDKDARAASLPTTPRGMVDIDRVSHSRAPPAKQKTRGTGTGRPTVYHTDARWSDDTRGQQRLADVEAASSTHPPSSPPASVTADSFPPVAIDRRSLSPWKRIQSIALGGSKDSPSTLFARRPPPAPATSATPPVVAGQQAAKLSKALSRPRLAHARTHSGHLHNTTGVRKRNSTSTVVRRSSLLPATTSLCSEVDADEDSTNAAAYSTRVQLSPTYFSSNDLQVIEDLGVNVVDRFHPSVASVLDPDPPIFSAQLNRTLSTASTVSTSSQTSLDRRPRLSRNSSISKRKDKGSNLALSTTVGRNLSNQLRLSDSPQEESIAILASRTQKMSPVELAHKLATWLEWQRAVSDGQKQDPATSPLLLIDARTMSTYLSSTGRLVGSININFPSLLIRRFRKGNTNSFHLESFITTEAGKQHYQDFSKSTKLGDADLVVIDDELNEVSVSNQNTTPGNGAILLGLLQRMSETEKWKGQVSYLDGSLSTLVQDQPLKIYLRVGEGQDSESPTSLTSKNGTPDVTRRHGLSQLQAPHRDSNLPKVDDSVTPDVQPRAPILSASNSPSTDELVVAGTPSTTGSAKQRPPKLRRIDTSETSLGASSRHGTTRNRSTTAPSTASTESQQHVTLPDSPVASSSGPSLQELCLSQRHFRSLKPDISTLPVPVPTIDTNMTTSSPNSESPLKSGPPETTFTFSEIIPNFLFLGSEPNNEEDFVKLEEKGIGRVLNMAMECNEEEEECRKRFRKYCQIPLRDFVEEVGVQDRIREANVWLDDAFLHSDPVYVHCKAGKSRSVLIVLAYLIHRFRWSLKKAYAHVADRRRGICPNIGFLAELMTYEERELCTRSTGVISNGTTPATSVPAVVVPVNHSQSYFPDSTSVPAIMSRRQSYFSNSDAESGGNPSTRTKLSNELTTPILDEVEKEVSSPKSEDESDQDSRRSFEVTNGRTRYCPRDSLPLFSLSHSDDHFYFSSANAQEVHHAQDGTWRPARQDPSSDHFLPIRRVSKAGLESTH